MQRCFLVLEILGQQAFNQAPFNPVLLVLPVLHIVVVEKKPPMCQIMHFSLYCINGAVRCSEHRVVACRSVHVAAGRISHRCMAGAFIAIVSTFAIFYVAGSTVSASLERGFTIFVRDFT